MRLLPALLAMALVAGCARFGAPGTASGSPAVIQGSSAPTHEESYDPSSSPILVMTGVTEDHYAIWEPLVEVRPAVTDADPIVTTSSDVELGMLGIEGWYVFARAESEGDVVFDAIVHDRTFRVPAGEYKVTLYYRPCDANCGFLDPASTFCVVRATLAEGGKYRMTITQYDPESPRDGTCRLEAR